MAMHRSGPALRQNRSLRSLSYERAERIPRRTHIRQHHAGGCRLTRRPRLNPRRAKTHRSYTIAEAAQLFEVHRNTVRNWTRAGLETVKTRGGVLILGDELRRFLISQSAKRRMICPPGSMLCLKCREPRRPPPELVEVLHRAPGNVNLRGICPDCGTLMHRRASLARLGEAGFEWLLQQTGATAPSG